MSGPSRSFTHMPGSTGSFTCMPWPRSFNHTPVSTRSFTRMPVPTRSFTHIQGLTKSFTHVLGPTHLPGLLWRLAVLWSGSRLDYPSGCGAVLLRALSEDFRSCAAPWSGTCCTPGLRGAICLSVVCHYSRKEVEDWKAANSGMSPEVGSRWLD